MEALSAKRQSGEYVSFCRICTAGCGTTLKVDDQGDITRIVGDDQNAHSSGYVCFKGMQSGRAHWYPQRILRPLKRQLDRSFSEIGLAAGA